MSIPKLKFLALFFVFFAVFWQITTSFYIKMLSAGRQDFSRAAGGAAGLPRKESLRLFQPQAEGNAFRGTLCQAAPHAAKKNIKACGRAGAQTCAAKWRVVYALPCHGAPTTKRKQEQFYRLLGKNAASPVRAWAQKLASLPVFVALRRFAVATAHKTEWRSGATQHPRVGKTV